MHVGQSPHIVVAKDLDFSGLKVRIENAHPHLVLRYQIMSPLKQCIFQIWLYMVSKECLALRTSGLPKCFNQLIIDRGEEVSVLP